MSLPEGFTGPGWDNLPPHLQSALRDALTGLSEAFEDVNHPLLPQLQALWDVADQIEQYLVQEVLSERE